MKITVGSDFDGYFERLVRRLVECKLGAFKHSEVIITAGPWRPYAVQYRSEGEVLRLDFYAALRNGFGELTEEDKEGLMDIM